MATASHIGISGGSIKKHPLNAMGFASGTYFMFNDLGGFLGALLAGNGGGVMAGIWKNVLPVHIAFLASDCLFPLLLRAVKGRKLL